MTDVTEIRLQLARQVEHWTLAAARLRDVEELAARNAWEGLGRQLGAAIRGHLRTTVDRLEARGERLRSALARSRSPEALAGVRRQLLAFRRRYLRTETTVDFYTDAVNTRTSPTMAALLRACDLLAERAMARVMAPLGREVPPVLTYFDKGLGASILKAGLRLWDRGSASPAAAIKIVRHNLYRPTALIHEAGHQVAHDLGWNGELAEALASELAPAGSEVAELWAGWASEIAADTFAFANSGFAAVAGLHDVLAGGERFVFRLTPGDPHPIGYIRVLLGTEMCRRYYGRGPWEGLDRAWRASHPLSAAEPETRALLERSLPLLPRIAEVCLERPVRSLGGRSLTAVVDPRRVAPAALERLERRAGLALDSSLHWLHAESLRLLALHGYRAATRPAEVQQVFRRQEQWMLRLGGSLRIAA